MMLKIEIDKKHTEKMYGSLATGIGGSVGRFDGIGKHINHGETVINISAGTYILETKIIPTEAFLDDKIFPRAEIIEPLLKAGYEIKSDARQINIKKKGREFVIRVGSESIILDSHNSIGPLKKFRADLALFIPVFQATLNSFDGMPDTTYCFGRDYKFAHQLGAGTGQQAELSIDSLEKKILFHDLDVQFSDIGGCAQGKGLMNQIYDDITMPGVAGFFGRDVTKKRGYLITGPSGCGKTMLVKALLTRLGNDLKKKVKGYVIGYEDITSKWRGSEAKATRLLFDLVKKNEDQNLLTLLFFDELHLIGRRMNSEHVQNEALDTLLSHLDGVRTYKKLVYIGATHLPIFSLDTALCRRFANVMELPMPDAKERDEIIQIYLKKMSDIAKANRNEKLFEIGEDASLSLRITLKTLSEKTNGFTGHDIQTVIEQAAAKKEAETKKKMKKLGPDEAKDKFSSIGEAELIEAIDNYVATTILKKK